MTTVNATHADLPPPKQETRYIRAVPESEWNELMAMLEWWKQHKGDTDESDSVLLE
jgi:hypothetical protein